MTQDEIKSLFDELSNPPDGADKKWYQERGYRFERLINAVLARDNLVPRTSYRPKGEQIDGSFLLDGRVYLVEAKWHDQPIPASTIYQFKGKVEGKVVGTIGVFISMSGYTKECVDALVLGKSLNVLLLDGQDMAAAVSGSEAFTKLLRLRLREAAETGSVYRSGIPEELEAEAYAAPTEIQEGPPEIVSKEVQASGRLVILCEGRFDSMILHDLAYRILKENGLTAEIRVVQAGGKQNLPRVANLFGGSSRTDTVIVVADTDGEVQATEKLLRDGIAYDRFHLVMPDPSIESWLLEGDKAAAAAARARQLVDRVRRSARKAEELLDVLDLAKLQTADAEFAQFYSLVKETGKAPNKTDAGDA